ncbi:tryptophan-rich sensory protein [Chakrabartia godavariana]|nr:tryptophan-rich sensory protein [Chakrabartia godavariana]
MSQIASKSQLRMSFLRYALVTVPAILFLGFLSGKMANSGYENRWFMALSRPDIVPPGWVFGAVWTTLYILLGISLAMILFARGAPGRPLALGLFAGQLVLNLIWSPLFFAAHQVTLAFYLILIILGLSIATTFAFARIRKVAAWLLVPYLVWLSFASILNYQIDARNPDAETLVPEAPRTQIVL